jgi:glutamate dehydrogenase/leucine dehydrogenase
MGKGTSVFSVLEKEGLTTLEIFWDRKKERFVLRGMKEWDDTICWDKYMTDFTVEDILSEDYRAVGTATLATVFSELGLQDHLEQVEQLLKDGRHHGIEFYYNRKKNIRVMYCKHVNTIGIANRRHAIRSGGIRRHELDEPEIDVIVDGLNLARAMSYKNAIASLPYGGSKILVQSDPVKLDDDESLGFLAYAIDKTRSFTGPDMGFSPELTDILKERFTKAIGGGMKSPIGPSGGPTAYGEYLAIQEACDFVYGSGITGRTIAIQGLGAVGFPLAEYLLKDGATLIVTDVDKLKVDALQQKWGADLVQYVEPKDIYTVAADVFSPCAMGGIITRENIKELKFKIIIGPANNQLKATSKEAEVELARQLANSGILFVIDWAHNTGGVITGWAEYIFQEDASFESIKPKIEQLCKQNFRKVLGQAKRTGRTPTEIVYESTEDILNRSPISVKMKEL